jgi:hypothetical protein
MPISGDLKADVLYGHLTRILDGLIDSGVSVVSYAADGTEVERSVQRKLIERSRAEKTLIEYTIPGTLQTPGVNVTIPVYHGHPICIIQDSKHALKTARNNLFSGARLMTCGNYVMLYDHIRRLTEDKASPLYQRDVNSKLDRQDDNAAARLFSSATLEFMAKKHENRPEYLGTIVYLFVLGELVDAYQNRSIPHEERIQMALRAKYFLDLWESSLDAASYKSSQHFLSREASDIFRILVEGLISLIVVFRDHVNDRFPLLPWLHSTEACEHIFGIARRIVKDFSLLDFIYMIPKLRVSLRQAILRSNVKDSKTRASGYHHSYFDTTGLDLIQLSTFPSDESIQSAAASAYEEALSLIRLLGIETAVLKQVNAISARLPSIASWYTPTFPHAIDESDGEEFDDSGSDSDDDETEATILQQLLDAEASDTRPLGKKGVEDKIESLAAAAASLAANDFMKV